MKPTAHANSARTIAALFLIVAMAIAATALGADKAGPRPRLEPVVQALPVVGGTWSAQGPGPIHGAQGVEGMTNQPAIGAVNSVVTHPGNADIMWVSAVNGGVWKTTNATNATPTWTPLTDNFSSLSIESLVLDPTDGSHNTLVAGAGESSFFYESGPVGSLLRTTNGGTSWTAMNPTALAGKGITSVIARGSTIVAGVEAFSIATCTFAPIWRSTDTGATFSAASGLPSAAITYDIQGDPTNNAVLYAVVRECPGLGKGGIYKSTNTGSSWTKVSSAAIDDEVWFSNNARLAINPSGHVFVAIASDALHIYRSSNGGSSWTELDSEPGGVGCMSFAADPSSSRTSTAYFGRCAQSFPTSIGAEELSGELYRIDGTAASGSQITPLTHCQTALSGCNGQISTNSNSAPHADSRDMAFDANGSLIQTDDGGVYRRTNPSGTGDWFSVNGNLQVAEMHDAVWDGISNMIFGGDQDTGTAHQTSVGGTTWQRMEGTSGDGGDVAADDTTSTTQSTRYASSQGLISFIRHTVNSSGVTTALKYPSRVLLGGANFQGQFVTPTELNRVDPRRILIAGSSDLYESLDRGDSVTGLGLNQVVKGAVYGGTSGGVDNLDLIWAVANPGNAPAVYVRTSGGGAPTQTSATPGSSPLRDITVHTTDWTKAYVINEAGQVFSTSNTGGAWTNITGNLNTDTSDLRAIVFVPPSKIVVGGLYGVFVADTSNPTSWSRLGSGLPNALVWDLDYDPLDDVLVAATLGRSAWKLSPVMVAGTPPSVSVGDVTVTEGNSGITNATFNVTLSASANHTVGVQYATANSTAVGSSSTFPSSGGVFMGSFGANSYPSTVAVSGLTDPIRKVTVTFNGFDSDNVGALDVLLVGPGGQKVMLMSDVGGSGVIFAYDFTFDDAAASQLPQSTTFAATTYRPTDYETGDTFFSPAPAGPYGTALSAFNGTSANGTWSLYMVEDTNPGTWWAGIDGWSITFHTGDYVPVSGQVIFAPGTTSKTITVPVQGDTTTELNETFLVNLSNPSNATLGDSQGVGTIANDETPAAPTSVAATATTTTNVQITWTTSPVASAYRVYRRAPGGSYMQVGSDVSGPPVNATATANTAYLYKVRAVAGSVESADSNVDLATTVIFTDPTIIAGTTLVKDTHFTELLTAVNAVRALAGGSYPAISFTTPAPADGITVLAAHMNDLRNALNPARTTGLGLSAQSFTDTITPGNVLIKALHITEVRNGVR